MEYQELIRKRCSCRNYTDQEVEKEKVDAILEAGRIAPTGCNDQGQRIIVCNTEKSMVEINEVCKPHGAKIAFIVCMDEDHVWYRAKYDGKMITDIDAAIVTTHMMLECTNQGLGSCWLCMFDPEGVRRRFNLPDKVVPVNILVAGYPAEGGLKPVDRYDTDRVPLENIVFYEKMS